jgi:hypothetical protein
LRATGAGRAKHEPAYYLEGLLAHVEAVERQLRKREKKKRLAPGVESAEALLRGLEISLRTNTLELVCGKGRRGKEGASTCVIFP